MKISQLKNLRLSRKFTLKEMIKSSTALRCEIDNTPNKREILNLTALCVSVLQPVRDVKGIVTVNSGFRCIELNTKLGSKPSSSHVSGEAGDIEVPGLDNYVLAMWIRDNLKFDQLILEHYEGGVPNSGWVHVSYSTENKNRNQVLTLNHHGTFNGLLQSPQELIPTDEDEDTC